MLHPIVLRLLAVTLVLPGPVCSIEAAMPPPSPAPAVSTSHITATLMRLPLQFEANQGQMDEQVKFLARGKGYTLFLTPTESVLVLQQREPITETAQRERGESTAVPEPPPIKQAVVRMKLEGANAAPAIEGEDKLPGIVNYFIGNDPTKWRTNIPTYAKVQYQEAYPGIDLAYYGNQGKLEYDFIVAPGADPGQIKLAFEGASEIKVADSGDLLLATDLGDVRVQKPVVYQLEPDGHRTLIAGHYIVEQKPANLLSAHSPLATDHSPLPRVSIQLAAYDRAKPLVIDPVLLYSTYLGGSSDEQGNGIAVDGSGQAYVTGMTTSTNFPTLTASQPASGGGNDAFVTKLTATGTLVYSTYLGSSGDDQGFGIAVDGSGQAFVTGVTFSGNFPTVNASQPARGGGNDAFVTKLTAAGALAYSTYLGGRGLDQGNGIAVDGSGQAYVTGGTGSVNFPTLNASQPASGGIADAFVTKLTASGALGYSTYLGGSSNDDGRGIAVDGNGQASVTGRTFSGNFPTLTASQPAFGGGTDAFVTRLTATGALVYSTYLGGSGFDLGSGIAVDGNGQAYVTGLTSGNFPTLNPSQPASGGGNDAFVTKLTATGALGYSTYLGGSGGDLGFGIAVDGSGQAYVTGQTDSGNFPTLNASQPASGGSRDAFVTRLTAAGALAYSTYLGGSGFDVGNGIAVDGSGQAYVTGRTESGNFPTLNASQPAFGGVQDAFVTKLAEKPVADAGQDQTVSEGTSVTLDGSESVSGPSPTYAWTQVAGPPVGLAGANTVAPTFSAPPVPPAGATLTFQLIVTSNGVESDPNVVNVHVTNVNQLPVSDAGPDRTVQEGSSVQLDGAASFDPDGEDLIYQWQQSGGPPVALANQNTALASFVAPAVGSAGAAVTFELRVTDPHGAVDLDDVAIAISNLNQAPVADAGPNQTKNENTLVTLNGSGSADPDLDTLGYAWSQTSGPTVALTGANTVSPTFTAPAVGPGGVVLTFQLIVHDGRTSSAPDQVTVAVQDVNDPPVCRLARPSVASLWPPNHRMVPVSIMGITDPNGQAITITFSAVTQDEPVNGLGDGDTSPDAALSGNRILLRAERADRGNGRVYVVHYTATDEQGAGCSGTVKVGVPLERRGQAVEGAQLYNSFGP